MTDKTKSVSGITYPTKKSIGTDINGDDDLKKVLEIFFDEYNITEQEKMFYKPEYGKFKRQHFVIDSLVEFNDKKLAFEYDGPVHYNNITKIERDVRKSIELEKQGYTLIRFPYYLQFTKDVAKHFFEPYNVYSDEKYQRMLEEYCNIKNESDMLAPGWHTTSETPSNWVDKGFEIFLSDIEKFPISVRHQLVHSLNLYKAATNGKEWLVVPVHNENFNKLLSLEVEEKYLNYFFCRS
tara:strand:- start:326 stop:1039 length:714 start_codon:yes stop_codon:yes gene_type:complete